jgi:hypothetical protein
MTTTALYLSRDDDTYTNPSRIEVKLYFDSITINKETGNPPVSQQQYVCEFILSNDKTHLFFRINYGDIPQMGAILFIDRQSFVRSDNSDVFINVVTDLGDTVIVGNFKGNAPVRFQFVFSNPMDLTTFKKGFIKIILTQTVPPNNNILNTVTNDINSIMKTLIDNTILELIAQTDQFGLNLGEMIAILTSNHSYPNGYPKKLIGYCLDINNNNNNIIQTFYSFKPKLSKVLKGEGTTLLAQTNNINCLYDTDLTNCDFYLNILSYCTLRYMLAGLSNNSLFSLKWLYANYYEQFLVNLKNSEFSAAVVLFTEPQENFDFTNFNRYFKTRNNINH